MASLEAMAVSGLAIVVVSSELEEVSAISDRVAVLAEGRLVAVLDRDDGDITPTRIMSTAFALDKAYATA
jgi:ABC-type sugar transport system ATPase subunit